MNKEQRQIIDEAYKNFVKSYTDEDGDIILPPDDYINDNGELLSKQEFINKCKTDVKFSETWGLNIEERELSLNERRDISRDKLNRMEWADVIKLAHFKETYDKYNIPTKLITLTYNNKTIESYE